MASGTHRDGLYASPPVAGALRAAPGTTVHLTGPLAAYAAMPDGHVPPPDLAPHAYEDNGPALATLPAAHLGRHDMARPW